MKKKDKIYDSPEYKQIKEHLPEILKELERDKGLKQYQMPEGWNEDFERIYQAEHRKERIRNRILAGVCAAVILVIGAVHVGEHLELSSMVQADEIGKIHESVFEQGEYQYIVNGNTDEQEFLDDEMDEIIFKSKSTDALYNEIKQEIKMPFFRIGENSEFDVDEARYNKSYRMMNWRLTDSDEHTLYVNQQKAIDDTGNGSVSDAEIIGQVYNKNLDMEITIYQSTQDDSLKCNLIYDNATLVVISNMELDEFRLLVEKITYQ